MKTSIEHVYVFSDELETVTRPASRDPEYYEKEEPGLEHVGDTYLILRENGEYLCESTRWECAEFLVKALETVDEQKIMEEMR